MSMFPFDILLDTTSRQQKPRWPPKETRKAPANVQIMIARFTFGFNWMHAGFSDRTCDPCARIAITSMITELDYIKEAIQMKMYYHSELY